MDQKFQNSIDVNPEDMFGNSIDQAVEDEGANDEKYEDEMGSDEGGNINEV